VQGAQRPEARMAPVASLHLQCWFPAPVLDPHAPMPVNHQTFYFLSYLFAPFRAAVRDPPASHTRPAGRSCRAPRSPWPPAPPQRGSRPPPPCCCLRGGARAEREAREGEGLAGPCTVTINAVFTETTEAEHSAVRLLDRLMTAGAAAPHRRGSRCASGPPSCAPRTRPGR
jgi:hypothetical protein